MLVELTWVDQSKLAKNIYNTCHSHRRSVSPLQKIVHDSFSPLSFACIERKAINRQLTRHVKQRTLVCT